MLKLAQSLCSDLTGSRCAVPRLTDWYLVAPSKFNIGVDVADAVTGGATSVAPINAFVYGGHFVSGLERQARYGGMSSQMSGYGAGAGGGAGWGIPFVGAKGLGRLPDGLKKKVLEKVGATAQGKLETLLADSILDGPSGGTRIVAGPDAAAELTTEDFHDAFVTVIELGANFVVNGVSVGLVVVSKSRPVLDTDDLLHARAFGLMGGVGLATSLDVELSGMVFRTGVL